MKWGLLNEELATNELTTRNMRIDKLPPDFIINVPNQIFFPNFLPKFRQRQMFIYHNEVCFSARMCFRIRSNFS